VTVLDWTRDDEFILGGTSFACRPRPTSNARSTADRFYIIKPRSLVERYEQLISQVAPRNIFELGIWDGGSTAFLAQLAHPAKLVAMDHMPGPCAALENFVESHDLRDTVATFYGVDQNDPARISEIVEREYPGESLDLVIDDASHLVDETRNSFNVLFPRLAAGGTYVIEDWSWAHHDGPFRYGERLRRATPLSVLLFELMLVSAHHPKMIDQILIRPGLALVRRGSEVIDPGSFDVSASYGEIGQDLMRRLSRARSDGEQGQ
jgi:predicted O-methyltransferase YrrM